MFNLTPRSKNYLHNIWKFTKKTWSETQADIYVTNIYERFEWLAKNAQLGKHRTDIKEGYYCYVQGSHLIFYIIDGGCINIIGIPHQSMDIINYFKAR